MLCTPKGSPASLIYPFGRKLTFFVIKQFFTLEKEHQTLMRSRLRRFLPLSVALRQSMSAVCRYPCTIRNTPTSTAKSSTRRIRGLLRMTSGHNGSISRLPTRRVGMLRDDQVGMRLSLTKKPPEKAVFSLFLHI